MRSQAKEPIPISLSHLGETIVAAMANRRRLEVIDALELSDAADPAFVTGLDQFAFTECRLSPHGEYAFDGASRVDVILWLRPDSAVACELKLGTSRLTKSRIDDEFLADCRPSHGGQRLAGNMMAILDRRFGSHAPKEGLAVQIDRQSVPLADKWYVIVQPSVLARWTGGAAPAFSSRERCVSVNTIIDAFGGKQPFNDLVGELLAVDFYGAWIEHP